MKKYLCYVCGYNNLDETPWGEDGTIPSHNICDCCGIQCGYEDCTKEVLSNIENHGYLLEVYGLIMTKGLRIGVWKNN